MGERVTDKNNPIFSCILTTDNVLLVHEGVVEDLDAVQFEFDDEEWEWDYQD